MKPESQNSGLERLVWLFPLAYGFHIAEESNGFPGWVRDELGGSLTSSGFIVNNAVFMAVLIGLCLLATRQRAPWSWFFLFLFVSAQEFWNLVFHAYATVRFGEYSPGIITAVLLYLPLYAAISFVFVRNGVITFRLWVVAFTLGAAGMMLVLWAGLYGFGDVPWDAWLPG